MDEQALNELLECSVCLERLDHTSKVLPCQHTFCRRCLQEIVSTKRELRCPECRTVVNTPVQDLPSNILLIRLLEGIKTKSSERARSPQRYESASVGDVRHLHQGKQPCAKALFNYEGKDHGDLSFKKGDIIILRRQIDENWFHGELNSHHGFFPASYVQELIPLPVTTPQCRALYDFDFENENEKKDCLCFKKDELLTVIKRVDDNWLEGKKGEKFGIFPISFVEMNDAAKELVYSKTSNLHAQSGKPGSDEGATSNPANYFLNPLAFAGQLPLKRHSFTATPMEQKTNSNANNHHYRRSLELSSKGNLVILPASTQSERIPPPVPSHANQGTPVVLHSTPSNTATSTTTIQTGSFNVLDQEKERGRASTNQCVVAMFNYKPQKEDEVELRKGDLYTVTEVCQDGWYKGQCLKSGKVGVFPGNYVQRQRGSSALRGISNVHNIRVKDQPSSQASHSSIPHPVHSSSSRSEQSNKPEMHSGQPTRRLDQLPVHSSSSSIRPDHLSKQISSNSLPDQQPVHASSSASNRLDQREMRNSASPARPSSSPSRSSASPNRSSQIAPPVTPRVTKISSVPSTQSSSSSTNNYYRSSATSKLPSDGDLQGHPKQRHTGASSHSRKGNNASDQPVGHNTVPESSHSPVNHSCVATNNGKASSSSGATTQSVLGATGETTTSIVKDKKEKKDKDKISLVKRLVTSSKSKKSKPSNETDSTGSQDKTSVHTRSGSCPSEVLPHLESPHIKTGSFDSSINGASTVVNPTKPSKPKAPIREKCRCREPYPPQSEIELELKVGDIVYVHKKRDDGWYKGTLQRSGKTGLFPGSFVEKCE